MKRQFAAKESLGQTRHDNVQVMLILMSMFQTISATSHLECNLRVQETGVYGSKYVCIFLV